MALYCEKCGRRLEDDARFCSWCGSPVSASSDIACQEEKNDDTVAEQTESGAVEAVVSECPVAETTAEEAPLDTENAHAEDSGEEIYCELTIEEPIFDKSKVKRHFSKLGWVYSVYTLLITLSALVIMLVVNTVAPKLLASFDVSVIVSVVSIYGIAFIVLLLTMRRIEKTPIGEKRHVGVGKWLVYLVIALGVMTIGSFVGNFVEGIIGIIVRGDASSEITTLFEESDPYLVGIYAVLIAPVGEELVFRRLFIDRTHKYGGRIAIILSALAFALMHGNLGQAIPAFGAGLVLGYLYYSTRRLLPCILMHAAINLYSTVSGIIAGDMLERFADELTLDVIIEAAPALLAVTLMVLINISCAVLAVVLPIVLRRKIIFDEPEVAIPEGKRFASVILNVGMIAMLIVYVAQIILNYVKF